MALPTVQQCKDLLRIEHTAEDAMLATWLAMAVAAVTNDLGRPVATVSDQEWEDDGVNNRAYASTRNLMIPAQFSPIDPTSLAIVDADAVALSATVDYWPLVTGWEGVIRARPGISFTNGPYTLTADVGLATRADYATAIEPSINMAILDTLADWRQRRSPNATSETTGGGVSTSYAVTQGLSARAIALLSPWRVIRV